MRRILIALIAGVLLADAGAGEFWPDVRVPQLERYIDADLSARRDLLERYMGEVNAEQTAQRINYGDAARLKLNAARVMFPGDWPLQELLSHFVVIGDKLDRQDISHEEYSYLVGQKMREHDERMIAAEERARAEHAQREAAAAWYAHEQQRIAAEAQQGAAQFHWMADRIRERTAVPKNPIQVNIPPTCSTVPDGANGWTTVCR